MGQNIFIFVLIGALVVGFIYISFIRPKQIGSEEEIKEEPKSESTPVKTQNPKKKKK